MKKNYNYFAITIFLVFIVLSCKTTETTPTTKSSQTTPTSLALSGITGATSDFVQATNNYTFTVPAGTNIMALALTLSLPTGANVSPASGSTQDFTNPVTYTITAEDGTTVKYIVKIVVQAAAKSSAKQILSFSFDELNPVVKATINQSTFEITAEIPATANLKALKPTITLSDKATVSPVMGISQDFTNPLKYTVTAEDGSKQEYSVTLSQTTASSGNLILCKTGDALYALDDNTGKIVYQIKIDFGSEIQLVASPIYFNGLALCTSKTDLIAINLKNSKIEWTTPIKKYTANEYTKYGSTFPILVNEIVYLSIPGNDKVIAIDAKTGVIKWEFNTVIEQIYGGLAYGNGSIFCPTYTSIIAIDAITGKKQWERDFNRIINNNPCFFNNNLFFTNSYREFAKINLKNLELDIFHLTPDYDARDYERYLGGILRIHTNTTSLTQYNGVLYYGDDKTIYAKDISTDKIIWTYGYQPQNELNPSSPFVADGILYTIISQEKNGLLSTKKFIAINALTGKIIWENSSSEDILSSLLVFENKIFISTTNGLYAYETLSGKLIWSNKTLASGGSIKGSLTIVDKNGKAYYNSTSGMTN